METIRPLELYIHIPFCIRKCQYCDFLSFAADEATRQSYVEQLIREIKTGGERLTGQAGDRAFPVISVFIGGGTPSTLRGDQLQAIMDAVRDSFRVKPEAEVTIEANPGTLDEAKLRAFRGCGINRLSLGLQSANPAELQVLGRIHTWEEFRESFYLARAAGFDNINVDLMSALPGQSFDSYADTLARVARMEPEHISAYSLIIEEGTPFYETYSQMEEEISRYGSIQETSLKSGILPLPDEEEDRRMYRYTGDYLAGKGYKRYEISNYARPGKECVHNQGYWTGVNYLGIGLGAASLMEGRRFCVIRELERYLALTPEDLAEGCQYENWETLTGQAKMEEFMFLGLRLTDGVPAEEFCRRFGMNIEQIYGETFGKLMEEGLLEMAEREEKRRYRLTGMGLDVSNCVLAEFLL